MKILFLTHKIPYPPNKGDRIPTFHRLKFLSEKHEIFLAFPCFSKAELDYVDTLEDYAACVDTVLIRSFWAKLKSLFCIFSKKPLTLPYFYSRELHKKILKRLKEEKFDLIYVYSSSMAQYVGNARTVGNDGIVGNVGDDGIVRSVKKVIDLADADSHKWLQYAKHAGPPLSLIYYREWLTLRNYEKFLAKTFDHSIAISEDEKRLFGTYIPDLEMSVIPNGVDSDYFGQEKRIPACHCEEARSADEAISMTGSEQVPQSQGMRLLPPNEVSSMKCFLRGRNDQVEAVPREDEEENGVPRNDTGSNRTLRVGYAPLRTPTSYIGNNLVFVGAMDYFANIDAVLYFYKEIFPIVKERVPNVKFYIVGSNPVGAIRRLARDKSVVVTGFVEDTRPYLRKVSVCVVPVRIARGIQNKILESMAAGVPVVTTSKGNEGINAVNGKDIIVQDNPRDFAWSVTDLLRDDNLKNALANNARRFVETHYNWKENLEKLDKVLIEVGRS